MLIDWLTLYYTKNIGSKRLMQLITHFDSATIAVKASNNEWAKAGIPQNVINTRNEQSFQKAESALEWQQSNANHHIITVVDDSYPELLRLSNDPPALLFTIGNPVILAHPQLGIVGTRHPTKEGEHNAFHFAKELGNYGFTITSGLAIGIDKLAHEGALKSTSPTIAVLGTGLNHLYPKQHKNLAEEIINNGGCLISEFPLYTPPIHTNFPRRNRIISGLSLGTLVIEATEHSGSLITARLANENNREVFAIPSSIHNPQSKGCHKLIREGAKLLESTHDIFSELKHWLPDEKNVYPKVSTTEPIIESHLISLPEDPLEQQIFIHLNEPQTIDDIVSKTSLKINIVMQTLLTMEINGSIIRHDSQHFIQNPNP